MGRLNVQTLGIAILSTVVIDSLWSPTRGGDEAVPSFSEDVQPILTKYCTGCHNGEDRAGDFSVETLADLQQGLEQGPAILAGQPDSSRLFRVIAGLAEPKMPPADHDGPGSSEIEVLRSWIAAGAPGPDGWQSDRPRLLVPAIARQASDQPPAVTALAASPSSDLLAVARFRHVAVSAAGREQPLQEWKDFPGKVNAIHFANAGEVFVTASGVAGLYGQADVFDVRSGERRLSLVGHRDTLYDAELSPNGKLLATASYDGKIMLWDVATGTAVRTIAGHNGAVFDVEFDPSGDVLASASADETIKLWQVASGERLDTLSQPTAAQYTVAFSPDGTTIVAGGADNRLRVWEFVSRSASRINPLRFTRFAHDGAVVKMQFARDGQVLVTVGADRRVRLWETVRYASSRLLTRHPAPIHDLSVNATGDQLVVGRMDGAVAWQEVTPVASLSPAPRRPVPGEEAGLDLPTEVAAWQFAEQEPNDERAQPQSISLPAQLRGVIHATRNVQHEDVDLYRFSARTGEQWIIEIKAAREKSPLDSRIEVLTAEGQRIERLLLQAVRDSYFTFRGKDSVQSNDFRLHHWEEMRLNEYLYAGGEVTRLWYYPRGPDSGFLVYPGAGNRWTYFGTSAVAHALNEPAYIVEPRLPGEELVPTGLPVFPVYYENDDDGRRRLGADSRLEFTAPADGDYLIEVRDVRGFGGDAYTYELTVRQPQPDFEATITLADGTIGLGSGREFSVELTREDGFEGEVRIDIAGLPAGFQATSPLVVEAGQVAAFGVVYGLPDASQPAAGNAAQVRATASAEIAGRQVTKQLPWKTDLRVGDEPEVVVQVLPVAAQRSHESQPTPRPPAANRVELTVAPGQTISALVRITRKEGFSQRVSFGKEGAGRNLPHGVYVDNIGLNGLLIVENSDEREFFITADSWVPDTTRTFHLRTEEQGQQTSWPVILHVRK